jgi:hypothetical protein
MASIAMAAGAPELGSDAAGVSGVAQAGSTPSPQVSAVPVASSGASNTRLALQASAALSGLGPQWPAASASGSLLTWSKWLRAAWASAPPAIKALTCDDAGSLFVPTSADVIARIIPFDRAALERAIDRLIDQLDDGGGRELLNAGPARIILFSTALAGSMLALEVMRQRWQRSGAGGGLQPRSRAGRENLIGFPELPGTRNLTFILDYGHRQPTQPR